jgi:uncharacterized protein (TIGR04255 family)
MSTSVENAPLLELIAEVRWAPSGLPDESGAVIGPRIVPPPAKCQHEFFMRFAREVHRAGYSEVTRLVPEPFPMLVHQPAFRFNSANVGETKSLYQVGPGMFSANAVPPYESWSAFGPIVRSGVEALLRARDASETDAPFVGVTLRYIDAFGPYLTEGRDCAAFAREVLGIKIDLPEGLTQHLQSGAAWKPFVQFHIPVRAGVLLALALGDGIVNDAPAILMDTSVSFSTAFAPKADEIMTALNEAHDLIASAYKRLISPIAHLMPEKKKV